MKLIWFGGGLLTATLAVIGAVEAQSCGPACTGPVHSGCCPWLVDNCAQIPGIAQPAPAGTYVNRWIFLQDQKAEMDDFVIYQNMWFRGGTELGPMGRYYIDLIANRLGAPPFRWSSKPAVTIASTRHGGKWSSPSWSDAG